MRLLNRKNKVQRLFDKVSDSLDLPNAIKPGRPSGIKSSLSSAVRAGLPGTGSSNSLKAALPQGNARKAGLVAGGLASLTAGSAGISSLRRRDKGARDDS